MENNQYLFTESIDSIKYWDFSGISISVKLSIEQPQDFEYEVY